MSMLVAEVGGMDNYKALQEWAGQNLNEAQRAAYNSQLGHQDADVRSMAVKGLYAQSRAGKGDPEAGLVPGAAPSGAPSMAQAFRSEAEFQAALADPRWHTDEAYRAEVQSRTEMALKAGTISA